MDKGKERALLGDSMQSVSLECCIFIGCPCMQICGGDWASHNSATGGFYKCNRFRAAVEAEAASQEGGTVGVRAFLGSVFGRIQVRHPFFDHLVTVKFRKLAVLHKLCMPGNLSYNRKCICCAHEAAKLMDIGLTHMLT